MLECQTKTNQVKLLSERHNSETWPKTGTSLMRHSSSNWQSLSSRTSTRPKSPSANIFRVTSWIPDIHIYIRLNVWTTIIECLGWSLQSDLLDTKGLSSKFLFFYVSLISFGKPPKKNRKKSSQQLWTISKNGEPPPPISQQFQPLLELEMQCEWGGFTKTR